MYATNLKNILTVLLIVSANICNAQSSDSTLKNTITADSLASGNYKDILTSFYQIALKDLTGTNKHLNFSSNPFAIMLKNNTNLAIDTNYYKYRALRNLNINFDLKLDTAYHFNGFAINLKYALINRRDFAVSKAFIQDGSKLDDEYSVLTKKLASYIATIQAIDLKNRFTTSVDSLLNGTLTFRKLPKDIKSEVIKFAKKEQALHFLKLINLDPDANLKTDMQQSFDSLKNSFQNRHLLTFATGDTTYKDGFFFKNLNFSIESVKGFIPGNRAVNLEWDVIASYLLSADTLKSNHNLQRQCLKIEPGINLVIKNRKSQKSFFEFKASGSYNYIYNGKYEDESSDLFTLNGTFRIRIFNEIWIPLQFKYDPKNGSVFGFLNVTTNFTGLSNLLKHSPSK